MLLILQQFNAKKIPSPTESPDGIQAFQSKKIVMYREVGTP